MIQITLNFPSYTAAAAALALLDAPQLIESASAPVSEPQAASAPAQEPKRTRSRARKDEPQVTHSEDAEEPRTEEQKAAAGAAMHAAARVEIPAAAPAQPAAIDYQRDVAPLILRAANDPGVGPSKVLSIIKSYGAQAKGSEVSAERLPDLKLELEEVLAAAGVAA